MHFGVGHAVHVFTVISRILETGIFGLVLILHIELANDRPPSAHPLPAFLYFIINNMLAVAGTRRELFIGLKRGHIRALAASLLLVSNNAMHCWQHPHIIIIIGALDLYLVS